MLEQSFALDRVFHALADGTRRQLVQRLSHGPAAVSELARPLPMSLAAVAQHLQVLEDSGVVTTRKVGRVRTCQLDPRALAQAERWITRRRVLWQDRLDRLEALLATQTRSRGEVPDSKPRRRQARPRKSTRGETR
jgi:DNA-binding transcriptional ArsR family regulator